MTDSRGFARVPVGVRGWWTRAVCTPADGDALFAESPVVQRRAIENICRGRQCPVVAECRAAAAGESWGVWGGQTDQTRRRIRSWERRRDSA